MNHLFLKLCLSFIVVLNVRNKYTSSWKFRFFFYFRCDHLPESSHGILFLDFRFNHLYVHAPLKIEPAHGEL